jgi:hypothetical protein
MRRSQLCAKRPCLFAALKRVSFFGLAAGGADFPVLAPKWLCISLFGQSKFPVRLLREFTSQRIELSAVSDGETGGRTLFSLKFPVNFPVSREFAPADRFA